MFVNTTFSCSCAWFEAGRPEPSCAHIGSFEEWKRIIGGILEFAGVEGFLGNRSAFREKSDREREQWTSFLDLLGNHFSDRGFSSAEVKKLLDTHEPSVSHYLPDELQDAYDRNVSSFTRVLGKAFSSVEDRRFSQDGLRIERNGKSHGKVLWRVVKALSTVTQ